MFPIAYHLTFPHKTNRVLNKNNNFCGKKTEKKLTSFSLRMLQFLAHQTSFFLTFDIFTHIFRLKLIFYFLSSYNHFLEYKLRKYQTFSKKLCIWGHLHEMGKIVVHLSRRHPINTITLEMFYIFSVILWKEQKLKKHW